MLPLGKMAMISRRKFLQLGALAVPAITGVHARLIEPIRLQVKEFRARNQGTCRFVHFSDLHYRGDSSYAAEVIQTINQLKPEFVCFTGDLIEDSEFLPEALSFIREIKMPVYGSPGNHDYWCGASFADYQKAFAATGGGWLADRSIVLPHHDLEIVGMGYIGIHAFKQPRAARRVLLMHYPAMADRVGKKFDLILSGHSHGGQVRIPFYGPLLIPHGVGPYDLGFFNTPGGPLYVNAGIGTLSSIPIRWNCRPEITVVTI
jgi:predicted MPP superfamily phosphohydrolase